MKYKKMSRKGYTISELLMTVLVLSMVVLMLGGGVVVVKNAYEKTTLKAEAQTLLSTTIIKVSDEFRFAENIDTGSGEASPTDMPAFDSGISGYRMRFDNQDGKICRRDTINNRTAQILTDKTMTNGLTHSISYTYEEFFTATIKVMKGDQICAEQTIKVRPLN